MKKISLLLVSVCFLIFPVVHAEWTEFLSSGTPAICINGQTMEGFQLDPSSLKYRIHCSETSISNYHKGFVLPRTDNLIERMCDGESERIKTDSRIATLEKEKASIEKNLNEALERIESIEAELRLIPTNKQKK